MATRKHTISHPLPFAGDISSFNKKMLTGPAKHKNPKGPGHLKGPKRFPVTELQPTAAEVASQQRTKPCDELGYDMLLQRIRSRRVVPFVGAGLSMPLLPSWLDVLKKVGENLDMDLSESKESAPVITEMLREKVLRKKQAAAKKCRSAAAASSGTGKPALERQKSMTPVSSDLADEFVKVFETQIRARQADEFVDSLVHGGQSSRYVKNPAIKDAMKLPLALMSGPWPLIMTTNWDTLLEAAYQLFCSTGTPPLDVWDEDHPSDRHFYRRHSRAQVRYRANVQEVFAELRAGLSPPRLLKLHGDFTERGRHELVAGHADYRRLMVHEVAFARFMQYICSNYSLLFFGCSLTDPDLLATLDTMVESLGGEVGPHFWLTADDVSDARTDFLRRHYSVFTIRTPEKFQFTEVGNLLVNVCNKGWNIPRPLEFEALSFTINSWVSDGPAVRLFVENSTPGQVLERATPDVPVVVGVSCGCGNRGHPSFGTQGVTMLGQRLRGWKRTDEPHFKPFVGDKNYHWRSVLWEEDDLAYWLVCGQDVQGSGSLGSLFDAVQHFVLRASSKVCSGILDPPVDMYKEFYGSKLPKNHAQLLEWRRERAAEREALLTKATALPTVQEVIRDDEKAKTSQVKASPDLPAGKKAGMKTFMGKLVDFVLGDDPSSEDDTSSVGSLSPTRSEDVVGAHSVKTVAEVSTNKSPATTTSAPRATSAPSSAVSETTEPQTSSCLSEAAPPKSALGKASESLQVAKSESATKREESSTYAEQKGASFREEAPAAKEGLPAQTNAPGVPNIGEKSTTAATMKNPSQTVSSTATPVSSLATPVSSTEASVTEKQSTSAGEGGPSASHKPVSKDTTTGKDGPSANHNPESEDTTGSAGKENEAASADKASGKKDAKIVQLPDTQSITTLPKMSSRRTETTVTSSSKAFKVSSEAKQDGSSPATERAPASHLNTKAEEPREAPAPEVKEKTPPKRIVLCLPLISAGGGHLHSQEVLSASVSAIGSILKDYLPPCPLDVVLCLSTPDPQAQGGRLALMADIQGGRVVIGDVLSRSLSNCMEFTCIAPMESTHIPGKSEEAIKKDSPPTAHTDDHAHWRCRRVVTSLGATLNDLRQHMDFIVDEDDVGGQLSLLSMNITDGSVVKLDEYGQIEK